MNKTELVEFEVVKKTPRICFLVSLSNGETMIQDNRGEGHLHAWNRLKAFLSHNPELKITGLRLQNRKTNKIIEMPSGQDGYFFGQKVQMMYPPGHQVHTLGIGFYDGKEAHVSWVELPRLKRLKTETRSKGECGFSLIENKNE